MTRKIFLLMTFMLGTALCFEAAAQSPANNLKINAKPKNMWELGINVGHTALTGDVDWNSSFGAGLHLRKAIDYMFSIRLDANYTKLKGEEEDDIRSSDGNRWARQSPGAFGAGWMPVYETTLISGDINIVASLNNFRTNRNNKLNPYVFVGAGISSIEANAIDGSDELNIAKNGFDDEWEISAHYDAGAGLGFRLGKKASLSLEHKVFRVVGRGGDLLDAAELVGAGFTPKDDLGHYTNLRLGISLGKKDDKSVPLWWASPMDMLAEDIAEVKARPELDLTDTDEDGVIDMLDKEEGTEKGCPVNTRGEALDSDGDGIVDCKDEENYSPPGYDIDPKGVAIIPDGPDPMNEGDVNRLIDAKLAGLDLGGNVAPMNWFLPMIHFNNNRYGIKNTEYGKLHNVASVMKQNPGIRVVAAGYTDQTAGNCYNDVLSYNRANAAIDYLVGKYGISRDRFILNWGGENNNLVPASGSNMMNRRVEFMIASSESDMGRPNCGVNNAGRGGKGYSGNKEAGY